MFVSGDQNAGQSHNIKLHNTSFERVEQFKYLEITLTNQNSIRKEIKSSFSEEMLAVIRCRIFCLPVCYPKI